eukprot:TRINITY_DN94310_c0_g1_i1.p1 TRINITY_DN94310_c0_g1~~TRINITY_DN94310_c0_g1_i1.p1  ORF type:complete len:431 (-),score=57.31 TRINITY_DN94310_c0_g1_i1:56-1348(-)
MLGMVVPATAVVISAPQADPEVPEAAAEPERHAENDSEDDGSPRRLHGLVQTWLLLLRAARRHRSQQGDGARVSPQDFPEDSDSEELDSSVSSGTGNSLAQLPGAPLSIFPRGQAEVLGKASAMGACVVEAAVVVPTLAAEDLLMHIGGPWSLLLRLIISVLRLLPMMALLGNFIMSVPWDRLLVRFMTPPTYRRFVALVQACRSLLSESRCSVECLLLFASLCASLRSMCNFLYFPEVRWGLAITLDMWYLLSTPLSEQVEEMSYGILLVANIILCFIDTVTLILILAFKASEEPEFFPEPENFHRPRPIKLGNPADGIDPTCTICLCDFEEDDEAVQLPCNHVFHSECIGRWLQRSRHCPMRCPQLVLPPAGLASRPVVNFAAVAPAPSSSPSPASTTPSQGIPAVPEAWPQQEPQLTAVLPGEAQAT